MDNDPAFLNAFGIAEGVLSSGGAPDFLNVLKNEMIPFIDLDTLRDRK